MESDRGTRDCSKINSGISNTIYQKTSTCNPKCIQEPLSNICLKRNVCNNKQNEITRRFESRSTLSEFHIPVISRTENRRICPSHIQSQSTKRLRENRTISPNKYVSHSGLSTTTRLDVQSGPIPSVFSLKNNRVSQALPSPYIRSRTVGDDMPSIWVEYGPQNFLNPYKLGGPNLTRKMECKNRCVSRRLFNSTSKCANTSKSCQTHSENITESWVANQFRKVGSSSSKEHNLLGNTVESLGKSKILAPRKDCHNYPKSQSDSRTKKNNSKGITEYSGIIKLCKFCSSSRTAQSPTVVNVHELSARSIVEGLSITTKYPRRTELVDAELSVIYPSTLPSPDELSNNRRIGPGLGCTTEQYSSLRHLVSRRATTTLQSKRDVSNTTCPSEPHSSDPQQLDSHTMRQQDCRILSTQGGGHQINTSDTDNLSNFKSSGSKSNTHQNTLSTGQIQQSCRSPVALSPTSGMASNARMCRKSICEMGHPSDRFVCLGNCSRSSQLCNSRPERQSSHISRRIQCPMELPAGMGVPTTVLSPKSSDPSKSVIGDISNSSTSMGEGFLASGPQSQSAGSAIIPEKSTEISSGHVNGSPTPAGREYYPRSLEMWGWSEAIETWTAEQQSLLKSSWRKSTLKTYEVAWKRWVSWSRSKNIDTKNPSGTQLAQFLSDLYLIHNFAYNTILLHKSVISTLCNVESSSHLSSHVLVKHILKSIALKNPKASKPPVWDVSKLTSFLCNYTVDINNLFETSRHTAILLLLCSGRRIHDLTLLRIDPKHYVKSNDSVIFWPQFGSKTDCSNYRQSGWKLLLNANNRNLDPIFWIDRTITLLKERRNSINSSNLFITVRGGAKAASRTVIAGWVKTLFNDAGITASPGSTRSAVASKSWLENHPLDEILARGNWRSANTFQNFYRREVIRCDDDPDSNVTKFFNTIN